MEIRNELDGKLGRAIFPELKDAWLQGVTQSWEPQGWMLSTFAFSKSPTVAFLLRKLTHD